MATSTTLTINSRRYGSWSLRGWMLCRFSGIDFEIAIQEHDDPDARAELLLLSPSFLVPRLQDGDVAAWGPIAIGEYLHERAPEALILPDDIGERSWCRSISGEMQSGFAHLRSALPMNIGATYKGFPVFTGAVADIDRITTIWRECLDALGGPYLFGAVPGLADAMFAPVCSRFATYDVELDAECASYRDTILSLDAVQEWSREAANEPNDIDALDVEF
jgi:glutathione S-transferase